jgi:hypothetical protein
LRGSTQRLVAYLARSTVAVDRDSKSLPNPRVIGKTAHVAAR